MIRPFFACNICGWLFPPVCQSRDEWIAKDGFRPVCFTISVCQVMFWMTWACVYYLVTHGAEEPAFIWDNDGAGEP